MMKLGVNIDHVATVRQARLAKEPNLVRAAILSEMGGADGITIHLREDRRHIQDRDVLVIKDAISTRLNLEMATSEEIIQLALKVKPDMVTLVPEKRQELTTEGGLNIADADVRKNITDATKRLQANGTVVSLFVDPTVEAMKISKEIGADYVEIHTGKYSDAVTAEEKESEFQKIAASAKAAKELGLGVNAGHGLDYQNTQRIAELCELEELNIGHAIVARSIFVGLENAVREMKNLIIDAGK